MKKSKEPNRTEAGPGNAVKGKTKSKPADRVHGRVPATAGQVAAVVAKLLGVEIDELRAVQITHTDRELFTELGYPEWEMKLDIRS